MSQAKDGDTVKVHYTGTLGDGTIFDSSDGGDPLEFTLGDGGVIPGFEDAVRGMNVGETKTTTIPADEAYGPRESGAVLHVSRAQLPAGMEPEVGQQLGLEHPSGGMIPAVITGVDDESITIDANHPLAGEDLTFEIRLVEIGA
jgi:peptidylprolyl isomerase